MLLFFAELTSHLRQIGKRFVEKKKRYDRLKWSGQKLLVRYVKMHMKLKITRAHCTLLKPQRVSCVSVQGVAQFFT